jgi:hypothetical protein
LCKKALPPIAEKGVGSNLHGTCHACHCPGPHRHSRFLFQTAPRTSSQPLFLCGGRGPSLSFHPNACVAVGRVVWPASLLVSSQRRVAMGARITDPSSKVPLMKKLTSGKGAPEDATWGEGALGQQKTFGVSVRVEDGHFPPR